MNDLNGISIWLHIGCPDHEPRDPNFREFRLGPLSIGWGKGSIGRVARNARDQVARLLSITAAGNGPARVSKENDK